MAVEIIMPKAGMAMEEGRIIKWLKKEGEKVEKGEAILEIMTDKVNMEVEAEVTGILLKILAKEGEVLPVFTTIGYIGDEGEKISEQSNINNKIKKEATLSNRKVEITNKENIYDVIVIGGGPAGYVAAIKAAQLGGKVAIVEKDTLGGTCLNRGCIPTKTYLKNAEIIESIKHAQRRGIILDSTEVKLNMEKIVSTKNQVVNTLTTGVAGLLNSNDVKIYKGVGRITRDKRVIVNDKEILKGKKIILAGGSKAAKISIPGIESPLVLTSDEILDLKEIPKKLAIIGGGVIGVELAVVFNSYGTEIVIIEMADRIVPNMDREISLELQKALTRKGIEILTSSKVDKIEEENNKLKLMLNNGKTIGADRALLSIGRVSDLEGIGELQVQMEKGRIKVNEYMETNVEGVYAPGDINGIKMLAHAAFKMGEIAAANAMGKREKVKLDHVPNCIYTLPEVASVGLTEEEARKRYEIKIGKFPFSANGRALASGEEVGFIKVIVDKKYGEILGIHIIGPNAAEMINEGAALMAAEIPADEVAGIIHGHPTFSEAFMEACADSQDICIHLPRRAINSLNKQ